MTKGGSVGLSKKQVGMFAVAARKMWMSTKVTEDRTKAQKGLQNRRRPQSSFFSTFAIKLETMMMLVGGSLVVVPFWHSVGWTDRLSFKSNVSKLAGVDSYSAPQKNPMMPCASNDIFACAFWEIPWMFVCGPWWQRRSCDRTSVCQQNDNTNTQQ